MIDFWNLLISKIGNVELGGIIAALITLIYWFLDKVFGLPKIVKDYLINTFKGNKSSAKIKESDVLNHDIFNYIDFWMYSQVPTIEFSSEYRTVVFRKYLKIYLKTFKNNLKNWISAKKFEEMDESQLWTSFLSIINQTIYDYEKEMEEVGIPKLIIEKMKLRNNDNISLTIDLLEGICTSPFYVTDKNLLKVYSILNVILSVLQKTINTSNVICNQINGELKGFKMDGKTER